MHTFIDAQDFEACRTDDVVLRHVRPRVRNAVERDALSDETGERSRRLKRTLGRGSGVLHTSRP